MWEESLVLAGNGPSTICVMSVTGSVTASSWVPSRAFTGAGGSVAGGSGSVADVVLGLVADFGSGSVTGMMLGLGSVTGVGLSFGSTFGFVSWICIFASVATRNGTS